MENNNEEKQSDKLRDMAGSIDVLMIFADIVIVIGGIALFFVFCFESVKVLMAGVLLVGVLLSIYITNVLLGSKSAFYKNQAEMLDVLKEINEKMK